MGLSLYEQETIINMNNDEKEMDIYTASPALMRRLSSLPAYTKTGERKNGGQVVAMTFKADKKLLALRGKIFKKEYTEEQRAEMSARAKQMNETRKAALLSDSSTRWRCPTK